MAAVEEVVQGCLLSEEMGMEVSVSWRSETRLRKGGAGASHWSYLGRRFEFRLKM